MHHRAAFGVEYAGMYGLVGGKMEDGEDWRTCARREFLEETGVDIDDSKFFKASWSERKDKDGNQKIILFVIFRGLVDKVYNMEKDKCQELVFCDPHNLPENSFPDLKEFLRAMPWQLLRHEDKTA